VDRRTDDQVAAPAVVTRSSDALLALAVIAAALVRGGLAYWHGLALEQEGVEYVRIAENLLNGRGYVGIFNNGTQLNFPPLYPLMIAALSLITGSGEWAARVINIAFGAALVVPMFKISERLYGRRAAIAVAALVVFHPVLIAAGASTYSEGPYLTLMMFAMLCLTRWVADRRPASGVAAGVFMGLAYLIRPEAFLIAGLCVVAGLVSTMFVVQRRATWIGTLAMAAAFALVALPNVAFLTYSTGHFRIEAKGTLAYQWGQRMNQGMSYYEAANAIGPDLSDVGVFMRPNLEIINSTSFSARDYFVFVMTAVQRNVAWIVSVIAKGKPFGSPWLFTLVALGLCRSAWDRRRAVTEGMMLALAAMFVFVLLAVQWISFRYFIPVLGVLLFWAGKGAEELNVWARDTFLALTGRSGSARIAGESLKWLSIVIILATSLSATPKEEQFTQSLAWERRDAGRWLAQQEPRPKWVMDAGLQVTYYAGADLIYLPYADSNLALLYIAKRRPDYIVLKSEDLESLPYTAMWFQQGIPDQRAVLVYDRGTTASERVKIYRWIDEPTKGS
jgi:4-amino-4-deoxy-L-arabinose transferase-like glycosyltransferase